jgi:lysophospholipase L1-like esterase
VVWKNLALGAASLGFALLGTEVFVRATSLDRRLLGDPFLDASPILRMLATDPYLQWRGRPGHVPVPGETLNARGFRGPLPEVPKRAGVVRIAALGDSCTFGVIGTGDGLVGVDPYPARLQRLLERRASVRRYEVINYGVVGYTTWHGLRLLRSEVLDDEPDVVTIRFGWNDHLGSPAWRSFAASRSSALETLELWAHRSRLLAMLLQRRSPQLSVDSGTWRVSEAPIVWVAPEAYALHLSRMIELVRAGRARPILLDAPAARLTRRLRTDTAFLGATGYASFEGLLEVHRRYQEIAARIAEEQRVPFVRTSLPGAADRYFTANDLVHPSPEGHERIARALEPVIRELAPALGR